MPKEDVVIKDIPMKDVAKVMREVGYNKTNIDSKKGSDIEDQLAQANENAKSVPTMADAVNRAVTAVSPPVKAPIKIPTGPSLPGKNEHKGSKSEAIKKLKEKHKAEPPKKEKPSGKRTILIDMTALKTKVTFTGKGWKPLDIRLANDAMIRAFRIKVRDEYRKEIK